MGYRIEYPADPKTKRSQGFRTFLFLALFSVVILGIIRKDSREFLQKLLFPGDAAVAVSAFENMASELKAGSSLSDAFFRFCQQVFRG